MCRLAIYLGPPILMSEFVTEPAHSIVVQSMDAVETGLKSNGDGFGVSWFVPSISPLPAQFREVTPAWSNENLLQLARVTTSPCIMAHVRKASPGISVVATNCHPFIHDRWSFMHNGYIGMFTRIKKHIVSILSEEAFQIIKGTTDSEYSFALFLHYYAQLRQESLNNNQGDRARDKLHTMSEAISKVISTIEDLGKYLPTDDPQYQPSDFYNLLNFVVSDGDHVVATRFTTGPLHDAHTLYYCTGHKFKVHENGSPHVEKSGNKVHLEKDEHFKEHEKMVIISSEPLTSADDFIEVPPNYIVAADRHSIALKSIDDLRVVAQQKLGKEKISREQEKIHRLEKEKSADTGLNVHINSAKQHQPIHRTGTI
eukprot:TRINITY_DN1844_c0_g1_i2.p1 TRINITY_DN1844_c0_g1~~TRINITY_DN1844_c0_g1_i2.p1  ORF type:complete len:396 (-),score=81.12 TRINITY_DN1844_c0_g1_i2:62-1171(-)